MRGNGQKLNGFGQKVMLLINVPCEQRHIVWRHNAIESICRPTGRQNRKHVIFLVPLATYVKNIYRQTARRQFNEFTGSGEESLRITLLILSYFCRLVEAPH